MDALKAQIAVIEKKLSVRPKPPVDVSIGFDAAYPVLRNFGMSYTAFYRHPALQTRLFPLIITVTAETHTLLDHVTALNVPVKNIRNVFDAIQKMPRGNLRYLLNNPEKADLKDEAALVVNPTIKDWLRDFEAKAPNNPDPTSTGEAEWKVYVLTENTEYCKVLYALIQDIIGKRLVEIRKDFQETQGLIREARKALKYQGAADADVFGENWIQEIEECSKVIAARSGNWVTKL